VLESSAFCIMILACLMPGPVMERRCVEIAWS